MRESEKVRHNHSSLSTTSAPNIDLFLPVPVLQKHTNGVIWYILGVVFVLALYPLDVAIMSIMM